MKNTKNRNYLEYFCLLRGFANLGNTFVVVILITREFYEFAKFHHPKILIFGPE